MLRVGHFSFPRCQPSLYGAHKGLGCRGGCGFLLCLPAGIELILQRLTLAWATPITGFFISEARLGSESLVFWGGPRRGSVFD